MHHFQTAYRKPRPTKEWHSPAPADSVLTICCGNGPCSVCRRCQGSQACAFFHASPCPGSCRWATWATPCRRGRTLHRPSPIPTHKPSCCCRLAPTSTPSMRVVPAQHLRRRSQRLPHCYSQVRHVYCAVKQTPVQAPHTTLATQK